MKANKGSFALIMDIKTEQGRIALKRTLISGHLMFLHAFWLSFVNILLTLFRRRHRLQYAMEDIDQ